jgi:hypothetical protein
MSAIFGVLDPMFDGKGSIERTAPPATGGLDLTFGVAGSSAVRTLVALAAAAWLVLAAPALGNTFYVSSSTGSDTNPGTQAQPWQTLAKVQSATLAPGDAVAFRRGDTWTGALTLGQSGTSTHRISFYGYGTSSSRPLITGASLDCLTVNGSFVTIDNLRASACGYAGFSVWSHDVTFQNSKADLNAVGVRVEAGTSNVQVTKNTLTNNNVLNVNNSSSCSGAFGVLLKGPAVVTHNTISGSFASCQTYGGWDGSGVEIFDASNAWVHHNTITNSDSGVEEGGTGSANAIEYNKIQSASADAKAVGIVLPGTQTNAWLAHNSIRTVGAQAQGIVCYTVVVSDLSRPCASSTTLRDNAVKADVKALFVSGSGQTVEHNVFNGIVEGISLSASNSTAPVGFVSNSDLHLTARSPAIDRGTIADFPTDLDGNPVPTGAAPDAGAYEFQGT